MTYKPTPEEVAEYIRDEVARFAETNIPGQTIFTIECNCDPHSGGLPIKFTVWNGKIGDTIAAGNLADAVMEAERRWSMKNRLSPLMIERHTYNDPVLEVPEPEAPTASTSDDDIPF